MIEILEAKPEDARDINNLLKKTWLDTYPNEEAGISKEDISKFIEERLTEDSIALRAEAIKNKGVNKNIFLAKDGSNVVGDCSVLDNGETYQLKGMYVLPEYQRRGIGQMFWKYAQDFLTDKKDIIVWVASYNEKAINFYQKLGFVKTDKDMSSQAYELSPGKYIPEIEMVLKR